FKNLSYHILDALGGIVSHKSTASNIHLRARVVNRALIVHQSPCSLGILFLYCFCLVLHMRDKKRFPIPSLARIEPTTTRCTVGAVKIFDKGSPFFRWNKSTPPALIIKTIDMFTKFNYNLF